MKKRTFIAPLAASVAALIAGSSQSASATVPKPEMSGTEVKGMATPAVANPSGPLTLERAQSKNAGVIFADHSSHASHDSHSSHSSHSSGGY